MAEPNIIVRVDHFINPVPGLGQEVLDSIVALGLSLTKMENLIMATLEELTAKANELLAKNQQLINEVNDANVRTDNLIVVATTTKDTLVAVRAELAALQAAGATPQQLDGVVALLDQGIGVADAGIAAANAQDVETDAAAVNVAP